MIDARQAWWNVERMLELSPEALLEHRESLRELEGRFDLWVADVSSYGRFSLSVTLFFYENTCNPLADGPGYPVGVRFAIGPRLGERLPLPGPVRDKAFVAFLRKVHEKGYALTPVDVHGRFEVWASWLLGGRLGA